MTLLLALACTTPPTPPPGAPWNCDVDGARTDCFQHVDGATFSRGAQASDPAGRGYDADAAPNEGPVREVTVEPFWLQRTELTVGTWRACVRGGGCAASEAPEDGGFATAYPASEPDDAARDRMPLVGVTWAGAEAACAWLGGRLPTEEEWELAARGTDDRRWPWGDEPDCPTVRRDDAFGFLEQDRDALDCTETGPRPFSDVPARSAAGLVAMAGNLWEWTSDAYETNDTGTSNRVVRGGSWTGSRPAEFRATVRAGLQPDLRLPDVGARCAWPGPAR